MLVGAPTLFRELANGKPDNLIQSPLSCLIINKDVMPRWIRCSVYPVRQIAPPRRPQLARRPFSISFTGSYGEDEAHSGSRAAAAALALARRHLIRSQTEQRRCNYRAKSDPPQAAAANRRAWSHSRRTGGAVDHWESGKLAGIQFHSCRVDGMDGRREGTEPVRSGTVDVQGDV